MDNLNKNPNVKRVSIQETPIASSTVPPLSTPVKAISANSIIRTSSVVPQTPRSSRRIMALLEKHHMRFMTETKRQFMIKQTQMMDEFKKELQAQIQ